MICYPGFALHDQVEAGWKDEEKQDWPYANESTSWMRDTQALIITLF